MKQSKQEKKPKATHEKLNTENLTMLGNIRYCKNCGSVLMKSARGLFCPICYERE